MSPTSASAYRRLVTVATLAAIAWTFACRPAWSPNSSQIVFPGKVGQNMALARYDLAKQTSEIIHINQIEQEFVVPHYLPNGDLLLLSMKEGSKKTLRVRRIPFSAPAGTKPVGPFEIETENNALDHLILPPVIVDGVMYVTDSRGSVYAVDGADGHLLWIYDVTELLGGARQAGYIFRHRGVTYEDGVVYSAAGSSRHARYRRRRRWRLPSGDNFH